MAFDYTTHAGSPELGGRENHYLRIASEEGAPIFLRGGRFYWEDGQEVAPSKLPAWAKRAVQQLDAGALAQVGHTKAPTRTIDKIPLPIEPDEEVDEAEQLADAEIKQLEDEVADDLAAEEAAKAAKKPAKIDPSLLKGAKNG